MKMVSSFLIVTFLFSFCNNVSERSLIDNQSINGQMPDTSKTFIKNDLGNKEYIESNKKRNISSELEVQNIEKGIFRDSINSILSRNATKGDKKILFKNPRIGKDANKVIGYLNVELLKLNSEIFIPIPDGSLIPVTINTTYPKSKYSLGSWIGKSKDESNSYASFTLTGKKLIGEILYKQEVYVIEYVDEDKHAIRKVKKKEKIEK